MNKRYFGGFLIILFLFQVAINICHSVTVFPFLHYAMYSESFNKPSNIRVYEIIVNQKQLTSSNYRIHQWDMIHQPLNAFDKQVNTQDFSLDKKAIEEGMNYMHLTLLYKAVQVNLNNDLNLIQQFPYWYKQYLQKIIKQPILSLSVNICDYDYTADRYTLRQRKTWIKI